MSSTVSRTSARNHSRCTPTVNSCVSGRLSPVSTATFPRIVVHFDGTQRRGSNESSINIDVHALRVRRKGYRSGHECPSFCFSSILDIRENYTQTTTAAAPASIAPTPQAQPVTSAAIRGACPVLLAVTVAVTVTLCVLIYAVLFVPFDTLAIAGEAAELKAGSREVGEEGSSVGAGVVFASVVFAASVDLHVAAVGRSLTLYAWQKLFAKPMAAA